MALVDGFNPTPTAFFPLDNAYLSGTLPQNQLNTGSYTAVTTSAGTGQSGVFGGESFEFFGGPTTSRSTEDGGVYWTSGTFDFDVDDAFSLSAWFKTDGDQTEPMTKTIVSKWAPGATFYPSHEVDWAGDHLFTNGKGYMVSLSSAGQLHWVIGEHTALADNITHVYSTVSGLDDGDWHHVVVTRTGGNQVSDDKIYIDGFEASLTTYFRNAEYAAPMSTTAEFSVGARGTAAATAESLVFNGNIDEVGVWEGTVLTSAQVQNLYNNRRELIMARTFMRTEQMSGSISFSDSETLGHNMIQSGSLRTLNDDLNNLRTVLKTIGGESSWNEDVSSVGGVQRNLKQLHTHLDGLMSGSRPHAGTLLEGDFQQKEGATFDVDVSGAVTIDSSAGAVSIDAVGASNITTDSGNLTLSATTSGNVVVQAAAGAVDIDADSGALSLDGSTGINIGTEADVAIDMDASTLDIDASAAVTIDAAGASNFTTSAGALTLQGASGASLSASGGDVTVEGTTFSGNDVTIPGDLTVQGTTITLETTNASVKDSIIALGSSSAGIDTNADRGMLFPRTEDVSKAFYWDHSESQFALVDTWSSGSDTAIVVDAYQDLRVKDLTVNDISSAGLTASDLTDNRVVIVGTGGILEDDANFTFDGSDLQLADNIGMVFSTDDAEKIESDGTDLTASSGGDINLTATSDVNVPANVGMTFGDDGEKIEGDGTDLTINSSNDLNLTATADINVPANVGMTFGDDGEKIEGDGTDLTIASSNDLNLTATTDINVPASVGLTFGDDGEKIEGDGTDLTISTSNDLNFSVAADYDVDAATVTVDASSAMSLDAGAASNFSTSAGALTLSGSGGLSLGGLSVEFHVDGTYGIQDGLLLTSGSGDVDTFLSNFGEGDQDIIGAINKVYDLASGGNISKQEYEVSGSLAADTPIEGISIGTSLWNTSDVNIHLNGVLQRSGSQGLHDVYLDGANNLKFNFALEDGDYILIQYFGS